jgi:hypothetical protein
VRAAGVQAARRELEHADGPSAHPITAPAEDDRVDPPGEDPLQQHLSLFLVKSPADNEVHKPDDFIWKSPTKQRKAS